MNGRFDDLADQIDEIVVELDDRVFDALRAAAAAGGGRPADDKRLMQARRALEKAAHVLRACDGGDGAAVDD